MSSLSDNLDTSGERGCIVDVIAELRARAEKARSEAKTWAESTARVTGTHVLQTPYARDVVAFDRVLRWLNELQPAIKKATGE